MELFHAESPINQILAIKNDFETMKELFNQIVNEMSSLNKNIRCQMYQSIFPSKEKSLVAI
jgi:hypothetical protein